MYIYFIRKYSGNVMPGGGFLIFEVRKGRGRQLTGE
jgi:hypothetical protein